MTKTFESGVLVWTRGVNNRVAEDEEFAKLVIDGIGRHFFGDWGDLDDEDKKANEYALKNNLRLFSSYKNHSGKIYVITEADRSVTTVLFPEEY